MTQSKHTPGPWGIQEGKTLLHIETFESERGDGSLDTRTPVCSLPKKKKADALLIAAAPELLEALESCLDWLETQCQENYPDGYIELAQAAIKKAKGE